MAFYAENSNDDRSANGRHMTSRIALPADDTSDSSNRSSCAYFQIDDDVIDHMVDEVADDDIVDDDTISSVDTNDRTQHCSVLEKAGDGSSVSDGYTYRMDATGGQAYKQIRYLNSATYVCSELDSSDGRRSYRDGGNGAGGDLYEHDKSVNRNGAGNKIGSGSGGGRNGRSGGDDGHGLGYPDAKLAEVSSIYMPTLDLDRHSWSSNEALTYTNRKVDARNCKEMIRKTEAYNEWLSAKIESEKYARRRRWEAEQREQAVARREEEQRRIEREQKLKDWLDKKQQADAEAERHKRLQCAQVSQSMANDGCSGRGSHNTATESVKNYNAWLQKKVRTERSVRSQQRSEAERQQQLMTERQQKAGVEYERWLGNAAVKPKPVPLNRGLFTLRGSISSMYVNPVPWNDSMEL